MPNKKLNTIEIAKRKEKLIKCVKDLHSKGKSLTAIAKELSLD